jgi:uncharacterized membrane protein YdfJ with MMPL/SSD domain
MYAYPPYIVSVRRTVGKTDGRLLVKVNPETLARASARHPWQVLISWVLLASASAVVAALLLGDVLNNDIEFTNRPESVRAQETIDERFEADQVGAGTEYVIVSSDERSVDDETFRAFVLELQGALAGAEELVAAPPATFYDVVERNEDAAAALVSQDRSATLIPVAIRDDDVETVEDLRWRWSSSSSCSPRSSRRSCRSRWPSWRSSCRSASSR